MSEKALSGEQIELLRSLPIDLPNHDPRHTDELLMSGDWTERFPDRDFVRFDRNYHADALLATIQSIREQTLAEAAQVLRDASDRWCDGPEGASSFEVAAFDLGVKELESFAATKGATNND
jgi:hypothetical protein